MRELYGSSLLKIVESVKLEEVASMFVFTISVFSFFFRKREEGDFDYLVLEVLCCMVVKIEEESVGIYIVGLEMMYYLNYYL